jgi:tetratricopeptide (TPR) repeat protein
MTPNIDPSAPPPFHELDSSTFERLTKDLLAKQEHIAVADLYGVGGQTQYGVDVVARHKDGDGSDVAQCKCYRSIDPGDIRAASDAFLNYLESWENYDVRRFILVVACPLGRTELQDEIQIQTRRFRERGILYEAWDGGTLRLKLAPHADVVQTHIRDKYWVERICGGSRSSTLTQAQSLAPAARRAVGPLGAYFEEITSIVSREVAEKLEEIRELNREGLKAESLSRLDELRRDQIWEYLDVPLQAKILRVAAALTLSKDSAAHGEAARLADEAHDLDPDADETFIRTLICYYERGAEEALELIAEPSDRESFNLKVAVLIQLGKTQEALGLIGSPPEGIDPDAETLRLKALALLAAKDHASARAEIEKALAERPRWQSIRTVAAIVDYYSGISAPAYPRHILLAPEPVEWGLVRRDGESLACFRRAAEYFGALASNADRSGDEGYVFSIWHLASLGNDPDRQEQAVAYCRELLETDPENPYAIAWAVTRNFEVDYARCERALERRAKRVRVDAEGEGLDTLLALIAIYLRGGKLRKAKKLLESKRPELIRTKARSLWSFWYAQVLAHEKSFEKALVVARREPDAQLRTRIKSMILRMRYVLGDDWKPYARHLEKSLQKEGDGELLLDLCRLHAERNHWPAVAERAEQLVDAVTTAEAVWLAAVGLWKAGRFRKCLELLESHGDAFPDRLLPADLSRVKAACMSHLGAFSGAVTVAKELVRRDPSPGNVMLLMDLQFQKADLRGVAQTVGRLLHDEGFTPQHMLRAARLVNLEDAELAKRLWRRAKDYVLEDPDLLNDAIALGFRLGLDEEQKPLMQRMREYASAGEGPFRSYRTEEMLSHMRQKAESERAVHERYGGGTLPIHLFAKEMGWTLTEILHGFPAQTRSETDLRQHPMVFVRHGGRQTSSSLLDPTREWFRLHAEPAALLLAADLGVLDEVEEYFGPIRISRSLLLGLNEQHEKLLPQQPAVVETHRRILDALDRERLRAVPETSAPSESGYDELIRRMGRAWVSTAFVARERSGYVVDHLPLTAQDGQTEPVELPATLAGHVVNCRTVLESIYAGGHMTDAEYGRAMEGLGGEADLLTEDSAPPVGARLYLMHYTASTLAGAGLLETTCRLFQVFVDPEYVRRIRAEVQESVRRGELRDWLKALRERISDGLDSGTYEAIGVGEKRAARDDKQEAQDHNVIAVEDLLRYEDVREGDRLWIDDRLFNGFAHRDGAPIVCITDILAALMGVGRITREAYYEKLLTLRAGNVRYIPLTTEEIIFHIAQAQVRGGEVVETPTLSVLRRYVAACFYHYRKLQKPPLPQGSPNPSGEQFFVIETETASVNAIIALWSDEAVGLADARAKSEWILYNLYTGRLGTRRLMNDPDPRGSGLDLTAIDIGEAFLRGVSVGEKAGDPSEDDRRRHYFGWLNEKLLVPRLKVDPEAAAAAAGFMAPVIRHNVSQEYDDPQNRQAVQLLLQKLFLDMPEELKDELKLEPEVTAWFGIKLMRAVTVNGVRFPEDKFWPAAVKVINGGRVRLTADGTDEVYTAVPTRAADGSPAVEIRAPRGGEFARLEDAAFSVLFRDREARTQFLREHRYWFDSRDENFEREVEEVTLVENPRERFERVRDWRDQSAATFYRDLEGRLRAERYFTRSVLASLSAESLLRHYRVERVVAGTDFRTAIAEAADVLLAEEGLVPALQRLACLPVRIPDALVEGLKSQGPERRKELFREFARDWLSPIQKLQLVDLLMRAGDGSQEALETARAALDGLYDEQAGASDFKLFGALLNIVGEEFGFRTETAAWSPQIRLSAVWAHASRIYASVYRTFESREDFAEWLMAPGRQFSVDVFARDPEYWDDCLHPWRLTQENFLTHSVAALLGRHGTDVLESLGVPDRVRSRLFVSRDEVRYPSPVLVPDISLAINCLGSFMGGDRGAALETVVGEEEARFFGSDYLEGEVGRRLDSIRAEPSDLHDWIMVRAIVGDLPVYPRLGGELKAILEGLDFEALLERNRAAADMALWVAAAQNVRAFGEEEQSRYEEWLSKALEAQVKAHEKARREEDEEVLSLCEAEGDRLIETAIYLSVRLKNAAPPIDYFSGLVRRMTLVWPDVAQHLNTLVTKMLFELPAAQIGELWMGALALRASRGLN